MKRTNLEFCMTFEEIGKALGITKQGARQGYLRAIKKVKKQFLKLGFG